MDDVADQALVGVRPKIGAFYSPAPASRSPKWGRFEPAANCSRTGTPFLEPVMTFRAPVRDLMFALTEVVGIERLNGSTAFADLDRETLSAVLEAAGALASEVLAPINHSGDRAGATRS